MTQNFQVRLSMSQAAVVKSGLVLKQGDFGMNLEIEVLNFDTSNTTPQIVFRKPMGAVESTSVTKSGNVYTYTLRGTELDTPGKVICDLKLKNSTTQRISTASFSFEVVADTLDGLAEEASSYSDTIEQIVGGFDDQINNIKVEIENNKYAYGIEPNNSEENIINLLLFEKNYEDNKYIRNSDGAATTMAGYNLCASPYIPVSPGDIVTGKLLNSSSQSQANYGCIYKADKSYLNALYNISSDSSNWVVTIPENGAYIRLTMFNNLETNYMRFIKKSINWLTSVDSLAREEIATLNSAISSISQDVNNAKLDIKADKYAYGIEPNNSDENIINYFLNTNQYEADKYIRNSDGAAATLAGYGLCASPYIPVSEGDILKGNLKNSSEAIQDHIGGVYNSSKTFICSIQSLIPSGSSENYTITLPVNAAFIRLTMFTNVTTNYSRFALKHIPWMALHRGKESLGLKLTFLGDSITYGYGLTNRDTERFSYLVSKELTCTEVNMGISGSQLSTNDSETVAMCARVADVPNDTDILFVFGGTNDYGHNNTEIGTIASGNDTLCGAASSIIKYVKNYTSIKKLVFIIPYYPKYNGTYWKSTDNGYGTAKEFYEALKEIVQEYAIDMIDLSTSGGLCAIYGNDVALNRLTSDGLHPNANGHKWLANIIIQWIKNHYDIIT